MTKEKYQYTRLSCIFFRPFFSWFCTKGNFSLHFQEIFLKTTFSFYIAYVSKFFPEYNVYMLRWSGKKRKKNTEKKASPSNNCMCFALESNRMMMIERKKREWKREYCVVGVNKLLLHRYRNNCSFLFLLFFFLLAQFSFSLLNCIIFKFINCHEILVKIIISNFNNFQIFFYWKIQFFFIWQ